MCTGDDRGGIEIFKRQTALIIDLVFTTVLVDPSNLSNSSFGLQIRKLMDIYISLEIIH